VTAEAERDAAMSRARSRFEVILRQQGESICIASLPLMVEEIAADEADGDGDLEVELIAQLRRRVGLSV
jgi:hypothetical protein